MAWCQFCRREVAAWPGQHCPACGYQLQPSTASSIQADALAQLVDDQEPQPQPQPTIQVYAHPRLPPPMQTPQTIVYHQTVYVPMPSSTKRRVQLIEKTAKVWKAQMLLSALVCIVATVLLSTGLLPEPEQRGIAGVVLLVGLVWFAFARFGAWWNHG